MKEFKCDKCDKEFESKEALNMHNKAKHPDLYKEPKIPTKWKKKIKTYGTTLLIALIVISLIYWKFVPSKNAPILEITPSKYNFGAVSQAKGTVSTIMTVSNKGIEDLVINNMATSCGCTSASFINDGTEGPRFGMASHGTNPKDYELRIPSGDSVKLKVYYNPNVHREMRGYVARSVYIYSNDPRSPKEVKISANQVD